MKVTSRTYIIGTGGLYSTLALYPAFTQQDAILTLSLFVLGIATWTYHYFDTQDAAIWDHFAILQLFIVMGAVNYDMMHTKEGVLFIMTALSLSMIALYYIEMFVVVGSCFLFALLSILDKNPIQILVVLALFGVAFALQRYAEPFKYTNTRRYNFLHGHWHILSLLAIGGMIV